MRIAHAFNWHYAPPIYPDGDTMLWCKWCGLREVIKRRDNTLNQIIENEKSMNGNKLFKSNNS